MALCLMLFLLTAGVFCLSSVALATKNPRPDATITHHSASFVCPMQMPTPFDSHMIPFAGTIIPQDVVSFFLFFAVLLVVVVSLNERYRFYIQQLLSSYGGLKQFSYWAELFAKGILHSKIFA